MLETFKVQKQSKELLTSTVFKDLGDIDRPTNLENLFSKLKWNGFSLQRQKKLRDKPNNTNTWSDEYRGKNNLSKSNLFQGDINHDPKKRVSICT